MLSGHGCTGNFQRFELQVLECPCGPEKSKKCSIFPHSVVTLGVLTATLKDGRLIEVLHRRARLIRCYLRSWQAQEIRAVLLRCAGAIMREPRGANVLARATLCEGGSTDFALREPRSADLAAPPDL